MTKNEPAVTETTSRTTPRSAKILAGVILCKKLLSRRSMPFSDLKREMAKEGFASKDRLHRVMQKAGVRTRLVGGVKKGFWVCDLADQKRPDPGLLLQQILLDGPMPTPQVHKMLREAGYNPHGTTIVATKKMLRIRHINAERRGDPWLWALPDQAGPSELRQSRALYIKSLLVKGAITATEGLAKASDHGIPKDAIIKATREAGVMHRRDGPCGAWYWCLEGQFPPRWQEWVNLAKSLVNDGPVRQTEGNPLLRAAGMSQQSLWRVLQDAGIKSTRIGWRGAWVWYRGDKPVELPAAKTTAMGERHRRRNKRPASAKHLVWMEWRREKGWSYGQIAMQYEEKYSEPTTEDAVRKALKRLEKDA
jgi:hypothetical protein